MKHRARFVLLFRLLGSVEAFPFERVTQVELSGGPAPGGEARRMVIIADDTHLRMIGVSS